MVLLYRSARPLDISLSYFYGGSRFPTPFPSDSTELFSYLKCPHPSFTLLRSVLPFSKNFPNLVTTPHVLTVLSRVSTTQGPQTVLRCPSPRPTHPGTIHVSSRWVSGVPSSTNEDSDSLGVSGGQGTFRVGTGGTRRKYH